MSIDACEPATVQQSQLSVDQWSEIRDRLNRNFHRADARRVFDAPASRGSIYRWGLAVASPVDRDPFDDALIRLAADEPIKSKLRRRIDIPGAADSFIQWLDSGLDHSAAEAVSVVVWAAALPALAEELDPATWWELYEALRNFRALSLQQLEPSAVSHLMIGAELALTLAWRCHRISGTTGLRSAGAESLARWSSQASVAVSTALEEPLQTRLVLASALRCQRLLAATTKRRWTDEMQGVVEQLATWVCAMTLTNGSSAFSTATAKQVRDDMGANGLLAAASHVDPECLPGALAAALGKAPPSGRLVWQVTLPEAMHHDPDAKLAVMFPDWDVRRGRTHVDYSGEAVNLELFAGRPPVICGHWQTLLEVDGAEQRPDGPWSEICQYSDDDVHYLELEQPWTDDLLVQRQLMLVRDDRCLLLADSVIPNASRGSLPSSINYVSRLPLSPGIRLRPEAETREAFLGDDRKQALVIPLAASEWTVGPTDAAINSSPDDCLVFTCTGTGRLYAPLWFDFQRRRFRRLRTWRQLTVADQLRLVGRDEAVAYRVQVGSEHWVVYRSLGDRACRSFLGKHLIADFFSARFCPEDGGHEALVTVDDDDESET